MRVMKMNSFNVIGYYRCKMSKDLYLRKRVEGLQKKELENNFDVHKYTYIFHTFVDLFALQYIGKDSAGLIIFEF